MKITGKVVLAIAVMGLAAPALIAADKLTMWGPPPIEKPHFTKAAETMGPLPLPAVPERRTEKKRPPAAPKLIANLADFSFAGWKGSPGSVDWLLRASQGQLKLWYGWEHVDMGSVVSKHAARTDYRTPIFYLCAYYPLNLSEEQREALRSYVLNGGTLLINCCGQQAAMASVKAELAKMFPKYELRRLPADHPLYHSCYHIETVRYPVPSSSPLDAGAATRDAPRLQAVTLGTRAAAIVSFEDLASGWHHWENPGVQRVASEDSVRLGLNVVTYVAAEQRLASYLAKTREVAGPSVRPREQLAFVQLIHGGNWNPNPSAVPFFLKELASNTSIAVKFERQSMEIKDPALFDHPLLYMTGTWDPKLSQEETALLRRFLTNGGVLIADAASGRKEFDEGFRALCRKMFPDGGLQPLPASHPVFQSLAKIDKLHLNHRADAVQPSIEALIVNDRPAILYSKFGLSDGWAQEFSAYANAYTTTDALALGANLVVFAMQ